MLLRLLGPVSFGADEGALAPIAGTVPPAVLAHLALAEGRHVDTDSLASRVWDEPPETARNSLQVAVSKLRRQGGAELFESGRGRYRLRTDLVRVDWWEARQLLADARTALHSGHARAVVDAAGEALDRFSGVPLAGLESVASLSARESMAAARRDGVTLRGNGLLDLGRAPEAVSFLRAETATDPLDEHAHVLLMRALAVDGRSAEALVVYDGLRHRLADDLGADPSPATVEMFAAILGGTVDVARSSRSSWVARDHRIPQPATPLVGRDGEVAHVLATLAAGHRLVTVLGTGGIGKTHLALVCAKAAVEQWDGQALFVDLAASTDRDQVVAALTSATDAESGELDDVVAALAGRRVVLVLDNAEQVVAPAAEACVALLGNPETHVLVTSRIPLRLRQERLVRLGPLDSRDASSPAVALLSGRTDDLTPQSLLPLARRADGIPLVLELMASALRWQTPAELSADLASGVDALSDDASDRPERQSSLGVVIEWGLDQVSTDARDGLHALLALHGSFERPAAVAVIAAACPLAAAQQVLADLVDVGLVQRIPRPGQLRFRILEPIREFVMQAGGSLPEPVRAAHAHHFIGRLTAADAQSPQTQLPLTQLVRDDETDLSTALEWATIHEPDLAMEGLGALLFQWSALGRWGSVVDHSRRSLRTAAGSPTARAQVRLCLFSAMLGSGRWSTYELRGELEPVRPIVSSLASQWYHRWVRSEVELALLDGELQAALQWTEQYRHEGAFARYSAVSHRVNVLSALGQWQESLDTLVPLLAEPELAENPLQRASVLSNAGFAASRLEDYDLAESVFAEAVELSRANGQRELSLIVLVNHAWISLDQGRLDAAVLELADAVTEFPEALDQVLDMAEVAVIAGLALHGLSRDDDARVAEAYASAAVDADPTRFDPHMLERAATLRCRLTGDSRPRAAAPPGDTPDGTRLLTVLQRARLRAGRDPAPA